MRRCRPFLAISLLATALLSSGCIPRKNPYAVPAQPAADTAAASPQAARRELTPAEQQVRKLEAQLAEREREIAAVRNQIETVRSQQAAAAGPVSGATAAPAPAVAPEAAEAGDTDAAERAARPAAPATGTAGEALAPAAVAAAPVPATGAAAGTGVERRLADAQRQIAKLEQQLAVEVQRRKQVEAEMARVLQETSSGPFEHSTTTVEKHLRAELDGARREIAELRTSLVTERRERQELEKRYATLQAQVGNTGAPARAASNEELEALKARQRRVLASIQQDLEASRQREAELRQTLESAQGSDGVSLAEAVANLRTENSALQLRLDAEHHQNRDLSAKLQLATRVTDLIFKMQSGGAAAPVVGLNPGGP